MSDRESLDASGTVVADRIGPATERISGR